MRRGRFQIQIYADLVLHVVPGFKDNYFYLLENTETHEAAVIDPGEATAISEILISKDLELSHVILTHHHTDHVGGVEQLHQKWPKAVFVCSPWFKARPSWSELFLTRMAPAQQFCLWKHSIQVLDVRGHTLDHIALTLSEKKSNQPSDVFVGDSLFGAGCGGLFEGTHFQMLEALKTLRKLPENIRIWCAHEYTIKNLRVAIMLQENNSAQNERLQRLEHFIEKEQVEPHDWVTIPLNMKEERATNPFLRWDEPSLQKAIDTQDDLTTFTHVRTFRDKF